MVRLIDDRGRLFGKVNIVDIIVLLLVVALAVFVGMRATDAGDNTTETVPVKVTFLIQPPDERTLDSYTVLGDLRDQTGKVLGTIERAEITRRDPMYIGGAGDEFGLHFEVAPDIMLVVACEGSVFGDTVHVGSLDARVGVKLKLLGPGWQSNGYVVNVDRGAAATE